MILRILFFVMLLLALIGDARIFLFVMNRLVFGSHRTERSPWQWMLWAVPPLLVALTLLFWPLHRWIDWLLERDMVGRLTPDRLESLASTIAFARIGLAWLVIAACVGLYWIVDRARVALAGPRQPAGTRTLPGPVIRLRKEHIPFPWLRRLGAHNDVYDIEVTRHEVFIDDLPLPFDGYRIAFLTDTHVASFVRRDFYSEIIKQVDEFRPDVILLGGDFVTWRRHIPLMGEVLASQLKATDGVFAVLGNHDYWANGEEVRETMAAHGIQFVINRSITIEKEGAPLPILGVDEVYRGHPNVEGAFARVPEGKPCIGVTHHPDLIDHLRGRRIDLLVCGHTHGGQIRFPFFGAIVVPSRHESRYASGFHRVGNVLMYVSRGIGAIPPVRILCRPEVATFTLRRSRR